MRSAIGPPVEEVTLTRRFDRLRGGDLGGEVARRKGCWMRCVCALRRGIGAGCRRGQFATGGTLGAIGTRLSPRALWPEGEVEAGGLPPTVQCKAEGGGRDADAVGSGEVELKLPIRRHHAAGHKNAGGGH